MPQGPLAAAVVNTGGNNSSLNLSAAAVIKAAPGRLRRLAVNAAGSSGAWIFNDCATLATATTANQVANMPYNATGVYAGAIVPLDLVCKVGLVLSAVPAGAPVGAVFYD